MRELGEILLFFPIGALIFWIIVPTLAFMIISLFDGFPRLRLMQILGIIGMTAWFITPFVQSGGEEFFYIISAFVIFLVFFAIWRQEFRLLMLRGDDEFSGRFDKIGWYLMLTFAAPAGVWLFRNFRKTRWPEAPSDAGTLRMTNSGNPQSPWDREDELSPSRAKVD